MSWKNKPGNWQGKSAPGAQCRKDPMPAVAVSTYRRANGSQASVARIRVGRAPKVFPRAHTPSPDARLLARYVHWCNVRGGGTDTRAAEAEAVRVMFAEITPEVLRSLVHSARESMRRQ